MPDPAPETIGFKAFEINFSVETVTWLIYRLIQGQTLVYDVINWFVGDANIGDKVGFCVKSFVFEADNKSPATEAISNPNVYR
ncbi:hypothetical protein ACQ86N_26305 [Puia sp. P3]|uniref:hypothetical protein n=1 Tax=Puia sp. P3 TaxID=3423952 RepID=UPI003D664E02